MYETFVHLISILSHQSPALSKFKSNLIIITRRPPMLPSLPVPAPRPSSIHPYAKCRLEAKSKRDKEKYRSLNVDKSRIVEK